MTKKIISFCLIFILLNSQAWAWGKIGHRVVGEVASFYLTKKAKKNISKVLDCESLAVVSNWMDDIKSDDAYDYANSWHWVTIPDGMTYEETEKNEDGDLIMTINRLIKELKAGNLDENTEKEHLMMLVHLVGDIHQPLHVGTGEDIGGNAVKLKWFWQNSNLHRVWDSEMIDSKQYSYTELADAVNNTNKDEVKSLQSDPIDKWYKEAMALRPQVYALPDDMNLGYEYSYKNWDTVKSQLMKSGIRLAGILNEIYG